LQEKRQHARTPFEAAVEVVTQAGAKLGGKSRDISIGGMFVFASSSPAFGTEVKIHVTIPGLGPTELPGIVRWTTSEGFGVQFGLLGARQTHSIGAVVSGQALAHQGLSPVSTE
jgi:type IV pilus assembly protein PilZ